MLVPFFIDFVVNFIIINVVVVVALFSFNNNTLSAFYISQFLYLDAAENRIENCIIRIEALSALE